ncbi:hypothetical protein [Lysinibacillus antri]|uniref:Uncharacterized protein n=1 Tax=Lysinibacillus antri TaxID=2498145 RepID=A0A432LH99_9BACI|nr:hypothetical protein [Lysinibacillus antri]RUL56442.1 hypothetical protein EK386_02080 [Lysinibacillus antri]
MKFFAFDPITAIALAVIGGYLTLVFGAESKEGSIASVTKNIFKAGVTKLDESMQNYIEEKDEEMLEKMKAVKRTGARGEVKPIKKVEKETYEIDM